MSFTIVHKRQKENKSLAPLAEYAQGILGVAGGTILTFGMLASSVVAGSLVGLAMSMRDLPNVQVLKGYVPPETSYIYDIKGRALASIHGEAHREVVELDQISPQLKLAVLAIEDSHFYQHHGINLNSIGRAIIVNLQQGRVVEGASTFSMQLAKNLFLKRDRTFHRKLAEAVLAVRLERAFSKKEIFQLYLNNIYWGHNNYGVQTAAQNYFNKDASELNLAEAAMMAGLIQAPEQYSPFINYKETKRRQKLVLDRMRDLGWITPKEAKAALEEPLLIASKPTSWSPSKIPYISDTVVRELKQRFGPDALQKGGMRVQTSIDYDFQRMAEETVRQGYQDYLRTARLKKAEIALAAVDPRTHYIKALVGGLDYQKSQFNRAVQSRRQPGSSFKPFVYYTAFATGKYTPHSIVNDTPVRYRDGSGYYTPKNYGGSYAGPMSIRSALIQSRNVPAVKMGVKVGLKNVIETARSLGITSPLEPVISLPLGAVGVSPLEMAGAYATFANNGWHAEPTAIIRVSDSRGNILLDNTKPPELVLDPWAAASLTSVLKGVIEGGTGSRANIGRPAAGKTGTTSSERDVWFVGYTPQLATAVWIGRDDYVSLGKGVTGGGFAAPIWGRFMKKALEQEPVQHFPSASKFEKPKAK